ncbi:hypothetical protein VNI00_011921 [Paramarasmius palmivorus]|uniref:Fatty acid desaturase domain-containing protein n=1 Tax=Paramarasmius palmivorus TaxID=297713 RepID=A0AAW0C9M5_9AGAR
MFSSLFHDGPEYEHRRKTPFVPPKVTLSDVHAAVPQDLREKNTVKGLSYVVRDVLLAVLVYKLAWFIASPELHVALRCMAWVFYWFSQGILLTSLWCLAHEASHGNISPQNWVNDGVGFILHTFLLVPYFAWKSSHRAHHKATVSVERDVNYMPRTRSSFGLPPPHVARSRDYHEIFEETPIYTFYRMFLMQVFGLFFFLVFNRRGSPQHPPGTNHFNPMSALFKPRERSRIIASDIGLVVMLVLLCIWITKVGFDVFIKMYLIPWMMTNHWIVMLTYLHHSDPTIPYYRRNEWTFLRGAIATVDRPLLGCIGQVFFHHVSHNHVSHHIFSDIPFYNQPLATKLIKEVLKDDYNYDSTNTFRALYRTFTECEFIEDKGDIVFYKNKEGKAARVLASAGDTTH